MAKLHPNDLKSEPADLYARLPHEQTPVQKAIAQVKGMLVGEEYSRQEAFLRSLLQTLERTGRVTENQARAIERIAANPGRPGREGRHSQRYYGG